MCSGLLSSALVGSGLHLHRVGLLTSLCKMSHRVSGHDPDRGRPFRLEGPVAATMVPVEITIAIPGPLSDRPIDELATRARLLLVIDEVRAGRLTRAGAARALEMSLDAFLVEAGRHGLEAIDYDIEDFKRELGTIKKPTR